MTAMLVMIGTKYDCNLHNKQEPTWLQYEFPIGPYMIAIFSKKDQICQKKTEQKKRPNIPEKKMISIFFKKDQIY